MKECNWLRATLHEAEIRKAIGLPEGGTRVVHGLAPLDVVEDGCLYFINKAITDATRESLARLHNCIVIVKTGAGLGEGLGNCVVLETENARFAISRILKFVKDEQRTQPWVTERIVAPSASISHLAFVDERVEIGPDAIIEPFCVVDEDVRIGRGSIIRSGVRIHSRVVIGEETVIGSNSIVGHQGFGFVRDEAGNKTRIPHLGGVVIGSQVEIGALVTVVSGTIASTVINDGAKIDDHVQVGHNVRIGKRASVTAGSVIGGSVIIEEEAWLGINSSIRDGRRVGCRSLVGMDASVQQDLSARSVARAPRPDVTMRSDDDETSIGF